MTNEDGCDLIIPITAYGTGVYSIKLSLQYTDKPPLWRKVSGKFEYPIIYIPNSKINFNPHEILIEESSVTANQIFYRGANSLRESGVSTLASIESGGKIDVLYNKPLPFQ